MTTPLAVRLDDDLDAALRELAQVEDRSLSGQARKLIREALAARRAPETVTSPTTREPDRDTTVWSRV
jgi:predicted transcriptional regulator